MKGRKPVPTAVRLLHGGGGHRPLNRNEPAHPDLDPTVPAMLLTNPDAVAEWTRVVETLGKGHVTLVDRGTLVAYCLKWGQWVQLEAEAAKHPLLIRAPSGAAVGSPLTKLANRTLVLWQRLAVELGITPSSRSRIALVPQQSPAGGDAFTRFQQKREF